MSRLRRATQTTRLTARQAHTCRCNRKLPPEAEVKVQRYRTGRRASSFAPRLKPGRRHEGIEVVRAVRSASGALSLATHLAETQVQSGVGPLGKPGGLFASRACSRRTGLGGRVGDRFGSAVLAQCRTLVKQCRYLWSTKGGAAHKSPHTRSHVHRGARTRRSADWGPRSRVSRVAKLFHFR